MTACLSCLKPLLDTHVDYHPACLRRLFGQPKLPTIDVNPSELTALAVGMIRGGRSISGVQQKISVGLERRGFSLRVGAAGRAYIVKVASSVWPDVAVNEHLCMNIATLAGVTTPPHALLRWPDGGWGYIVARFDRRPNGRKIHVEDFCQLSERPPKDKYQGSAEECVRLVRRYASTPAVEMVALYRQFLVSWWLGNGDLHLKNLSIIRTGDGRIELSPAYDIVSTRLLIPDDQLALPIDGKKDNLTARKWISFAEYCGLSTPALRRLVDGILAARLPADASIEQSPLPSPQKDRLRALLDERGKVIEEIRRKIERGEPG